jgi:hypothetical protein
MSPWFLLLACSSDPLAELAAPPGDWALDQAWPSGDEAPPPALALEVDPVLPGARGALSAAGLPPGATVGFVASPRGPGAGPCLPVLGGSCLGVRSPILLGTARAAVDGRARLELRWPDSLVEGSSISFQAAMPDGPETRFSPVVTERVGGEVGDTAPPPAPWAHEGLVLDGDLADWLPEELFTSTSGTRVGLTWSSDALFVGVEHPDIGEGGPLHWVHVYVGSDAAGAALGVQHNTQQPRLASPANNLVRWKCDNSWNSQDVYSELGWSINPLFFGVGPGQLAENNGRDVVEMRIPFADLGVGDTFQVHVSMVYEGDGFESTYAGAPADSFVDGYDPDFSAVFRFDRRSPLSPVEQ